MRIATVALCALFNIARASLLQELPSRLGVPRFPNIQGSFSAGT